ncbi:MAG TPA: thioredoxin domain-containing protein [Longimicrobium sp.]|jgi:protein-disulfide isomerase|nr:thioredoxin domain-containing protein [Longimicrobium sp.]
MTRQLTPPVGPDDHVAGRDDAPATLVEFGDYECPHCAAAFPVVEAARARLGDRLRFVYRHFPLVEVHPHAIRAAEAAEAAGAQGKFWEMHRLLFRHQTMLEDADLVRYAASLGMDVGRFADELARRTHVLRVRRNVMSGADSGVQGTPTFFVNGVRYDGPWHDPALFVAALETVAEGVAVL